MTKENELVTGKTVISWDLHENATVFSKFNATWPEEIENPFEFHLQTFSYDELTNEWKNDPCVQFSADKILDRIKTTLESIL